MSWKPIIVGVDGTPAAARAGAFGSALADLAHTTCQLVHAIDHPWTVIPSGSVPGVAQSSIEARYTRSKEDVQHALWGQVPAHVLQRLSLRTGGVAVALRQAAAELDAGLIVLGAKHHSTVGEWAGRSTAMHLVRTTEAPVLLTTSASLPRRVLVALDLSGATAPTLEIAERYAARFGAQVKTLSVVEPLPTIGEVPPLDPEPYFQSSQAQIVKDIWPLITTRGAEKSVAYGPVASTIAREAKVWGADLIVVGLHGKGWFERVMVGSVTERLVHELPASVLVVPVYSALATGVEYPAAATAAVPT